MKDQGVDDFYFMGLRITPSVYVPRFETIKRSWKERLFTLPWDPLKKTKEVKATIIYMTKNEIICDYNTYYKIKQELNGNSSTYTIIPKLIDCFSKLNVEFG